MHIYRTIHINIFLIASVLLVFSCADSAKNKSQYVSLNGEWEITETASTDSVPVLFTGKIQVPSFVDMAEPALKELNFPNDSNRYFWYRKEFKVIHQNAEIVELEIRKAKYSVHVFVNGKKAGIQNIAYSSVKFDIKEFLKANDEPNELIIRVGTRENFPDTLICGADFEKKIFFPGIYDNVGLHLKSTPSIEQVQIAPDIDNDLVKAYIDIKQGNNTETFTLKYEIVEHNSRKVLLDGNLDVLSGQNGSVELEIPFKEYTLWSPENPYLYELRLSTGADNDSIRFGMRKFTLNNETKKFELNNKPYFLLGTNVAMYRFFEDSLRGAKPWDEKWIRKLYGKFKSMNWNSFRFHVGPAPDLWYDIADEMGFLIQDEYSIWYGKGGIHSLDPRIKPEQLAVEYENWMQDRWNHPSIVIWDAQNETVSRITGKALELVRGLDHSNRIWDNGYSRPARETDMMESHPYLLWKFSNKGTEVPEEGIMKHLLGDIKLPYNDPNEQDPSEDGKRYENATIVNEYGWLWLNRDGSTTTLTDNVYSLLFNEAQTPEQRFEIYAKMIAAMTEYWRAHKKTAGIHHFAGLTYSRPQEPRGQTSDCFKDLESLEFNEAFVKYAKPAFSKVALMVDVWEKQYQKKQKLSIPVHVINDSENTWKGVLTVSVNDGSDKISSIEKQVSVLANTVELENIEIELPDLEGTFELKAAINYNGQEVISYRDLKIY